MILMVSENPNGEGVGDLQLFHCLATCGNSYVVKNET